MGRSQRIALALGAVVVLVAAFLVARSAGDEDDDPSTVATVTQTVVVTTAADGRPSRATTVEVRPKLPPPPTIVVENAAPVGGVKELRFREGETIRFRVRSDVADEAHLHGYDVSEPVGPGRTATFRVPATITGIFELELEEQGVPIAEIEVRP